MEHLHHLLDPQSRVARNIRFRARRLVNSGAVPGMEVEDVEQDLRLDLLRRARHYDPRKASFATFADRVINNRIASLAARQTQADRIEELGDVGDRISPAQLEMLLEAASLIMMAGSRSAEPDLRADIKTLLGLLCPRSRAIALAVSEMSVVEVARSLGVHRSSVYDELARIRRIAAELGLGDYFGLQPTVRPRDR